VTVVDPIFDSLWEATLSELQNDTDLWEVYLDTPNFYADDPPDVRAARAETVLRRLYDEGWAQFIRRPSRAPSASLGKALSRHEIEAALARGRDWYAEQRSPNGPLPADLNVWLAPTQKWHDWAETAFS
jgi:hypothetical protein